MSTFVLPVRLFNGTPGGFGGWITNVSRSIFRPFPSVHAGQPVPIPALSVAPGRIPPSKASVVIWYGTNTTWLSTAPTFSATGPAISLGSVTVDSDTQAHATVTTTTDRGVLTWTDSTTGKKATQTVAPRMIKWFPMHPHQRRYR